jgi:hypothetical protein
MKKAFLACLLALTAVSGIVAAPQSAEAARCWKRTYSGEWVNVCCWKRTYSGEWVNVCKKGY